MNKIIKESIKKYNESAGKIIDKKLYQLCRLDNNKLNIEAKIFILGRTLAASVERYKTSPASEIQILNIFQKAANKIHSNPLIQERLLAFKKHSLSTNVIPEILKLHFELQESISKIFSIVELNYQKNKKKKIKIINPDKRAFCSKYLHFHLSNLFFIYDSRAKQGLNLFIKENGELKIPHSLINCIKEININLNLNDNKCDKEYTLFYLKAFLMRQKLIIRFPEFKNIKIFDAVLTGIADKDNQNNSKKYIIK